EVYRRFVARVAEGRRLTPAEVDEIGRGRIWSGLDALEVGLVDELGDVEHAVSLAKRLVGLPQDADVRDFHAPPKLVLPVGDTPEAVLQTLAPLLTERALLVPDAVLTVR